MPRTQFPRLARAIAEMTPRQRGILAQALTESEQPVLHALAFELAITNVVEEVDFAQHATELRAHQSAETERQFAEAGIPAPPAATGPAVFLDVDNPPEAA